MVTIQLRPTFLSFTHHTISHIPVRHTLLHVNMSSVRRVNPSHPLLHLCFIPSPSQHHYWGQQPQLLHPRKTTEGHKVCTVQQTTLTSCKKTVLSFHLDSLTTVTMWLRYTNHTCTGTQTFTCLSWALNADNHFSPLAKAAAHLSPALSWIFNPLSATRRCPACKLFKNCFVIKCLSLALPPCAWEMKVSGPCGAMPMRNSLVSASWWLENVWLCGWIFDDFSSLTSQ